jgi:hypothetical protein
MITPLGGASFKAFWIDSEGRPCEPEAAVAGHIEESDEDGVILGRTYLDRTWDPEATTGRESDPADEAIWSDNTDLLKAGTWDIWVMDNSKKVETLAELLEIQGYANRSLREQRIEVSSLMALPMWVAAPDQLKAEALAWLGATIQE